MPSVNYYQQSAPFWDFIASMEQQGSNHPLFNHGEDNENNEHAGPWQGAWGFPFAGPFAHRGRHDHHQPPQHHHGHHDHHGGATPPAHDEKEKENDADEGSSEPHGPSPPFSGHPDHHPGPHRGPGSHRGRCHGARGRGGWGGRGGHGCPFGRRGKGPMGPFGPLADLFQAQVFGDNDREGKSEDNFKPDADVFDTAESFVIHVSLPGAKKEDVGVNWDPEHSELSIAGVTYRPGDEELLKMLALDERKVGSFERKIRLGSRANPAQVDIDAISAKMEDGILRIEVPKLDSGYVEVKKVDIE
ncbi:Hypothetical protein R9X50_00633700 [Acrodontium crateriforme]|uniref:SHSP domain-containing protein n=1 Tax=Acrodontium crateriforme TaxID=150365 RepID=A0AAQ3M9F4_9PEZI|nr:Hypothetical protein R9X50_00633700 [Acrodontium crateriforme]